MKMWYNPVILLKEDLNKLMNHITDGLSSSIQKVIKTTDIHVEYDIIPGKLKTPVADVITKKIKIQDVYLAFLWCTSYVTVALNQMYYEKADFDQNVVTFDDHADLPKVNLTLGWARSLQENVTHWPEGAARPDVPGKWIEEATNLFQASIAYILFHEIGHLLLHTGLVKILSPAVESKVSKKSFQQLRKAELEADSFALNSLLADSLLHEVILIKYLGATLAHLSNFFINLNGGTKGGLTHPDLDKRLRAVCNQVKLNREADYIQFQAHLCVGLQLFLQLEKTAFIPDHPGQADFKNFDELFEYLMKFVSSGRS